MRFGTSLTLILLGAAMARADVHTEVVEYKHGDTVLEGYLAYDDAVPGKRPGVVIVHEWFGHGPYVRERAEQLAKLGYTAFALDMYGKGVKAKDAQDAARLAGIYKSNRPLMRARAGAALDVLKKEPHTDVSRIAAMGYCFGGTTVLEMARAGFDLVGVVSFHGDLATADPADAKNIKGKVLALHGADDPFVPEKVVLAFEEEMRKAGVDWELVKYGGAVHSFTNRAAGDDNSKGAAYNAHADARSFQAMKDFFGEVFGAKK
jgi:dienelactone hydrolase